jgi:hypothetical protein
MPVANDYSAAAREDHAAFGRAASVRQRQNTSEKSACKNVGLRLSRASCVRLHSQPEKRAMETLLAGFLLARCRSRKPCRTRGSSGVLRFVVAIGVIAAGFAMLDRAARPVAVLSGAASCDPSKENAECDMSAWSMARRAASTH